MKILLITGKYLPIFNKDERGAIEKLERIYLTYNEKIGDNITVYSPKIAPDNFDNRKLAHTTFRTIDLTSAKYKIKKPFYAMKHRLQKRFNNEYYIRQIANDIKRRKEQNSYDLIIFENEEASIPIFKKLTRTHSRIALHLHNDYVCIDRPYSRTIIDNCDEVWCVSDFIKQRVLEVKQCKTEIIPNTTDRAKPASKTIVGKLRKQYDSDNNTIFLYVGRIIRQKGVKELLEAFDVHCENHPNSKLLVAGCFADNKSEQEYKQEVQKLANRNPNIYLLGYQNAQDLANLYQIVDCQIVPTLQNEAFGLVVLEGMQANVRLIATRTGGISEIGENKITYLDPNNLKNDLIDALSRNTKKIKLPSRYYLNILAKYTQENYIQCLQNAINIREEKIK